MINGRQGGRLAAAMRRSPWEQSDTPGTEPAQMQGLREGDPATVLPTTRVTTELHGHCTGVPGPKTKASPTLTPIKAGGAEEPTLSWELEAGLDLQLLGKGGVPECLCVGGVGKRRSQKGYGGIEDLVSC